MYDERVELPVSGSVRSSRNLWKLEWVDTLLSVQSRSYISFAYSISLLSLGFRKRDRQEAEVRISCNACNLSYVFDSILLSMIKANDPECLRCDADRESIYTRTVFQESNAMYAIAPICNDDIRLISPIHLLELSLAMKDCPFIFQDC